MMEEEIARRLRGAASQWHGKAAMYSFSIGGVAAVIWMCTGLAAAGWNNPQYKSPMAIPAAWCSVVAFAVAVMCFMMALGWVMDGNANDVMLAFCVGGSALIVTMCSGLALLASRSTYSEVSPTVKAIAMGLFAASTPLSGLGLIGGIGFAIHSHPGTIMIISCIAGTGMIVLCVVVLCCVGTYYQNLPLEDEAKPLNSSPPPELKLELAAPQPMAAPVPIATKVVESKKFPEPVKETFQDAPPRPEEAGDFINTIPEPVKEQKGENAVSPANSAHDGASTNDVVVDLLDDVHEEQGEEENLIENDNDDAEMERETTPLNINSRSAPTAEEPSVSAAGDAEQSKPDVKQPWWKSKCGPTAGGVYKTPGCSRPISFSASSCTAPALPGCVSRPVGASCTPPLPLQHGCKPAGLVSRPVGAASCTPPIPLRPAAKLGAKGAIKSCRGNLLPQRLQQDSTDSSLRSCVAGALYAVKPQQIPPSPEEPEETESSKN
mmetsp:Transcript_44994/g.106871  ORF Transcript_44994/g.106871 Transcript_44994/m.106871 type:complete len:492 (+) Transcript_44994:225-1700(+)|eukprot:CAMPEP_0178390744 /NCGR_PEP_ID=MMETSP0689_2-20121128/10803_1 /TAXON_ID=160604 /ORGANISM="Amphidinium massartii, Strain CS-259" /LENGTH=491 /DNA_ID=CAMNT_0020011261 /DNA_START=103 /DNA_END=1578 /DNA_ORIENTATION=+